MPETIDVPRFRNIPYSHAARELRVRGRKQPVMHKIRQDVATAVKRSSVNDGLSPPGNDEPLEAGNLWVFNAQHTWTDPLLCVLDVDGKPLGKQLNISKHFPRRAGPSVELRSAICMLCCLLLPGGLPRCGKHLGCRVYSGVAVGAVMSHWPRHPISFHQLDIDQNLSSTVTDFVI
jgi:hypothetical protein